MATRRSSAPENVSEIAWRFITSHAHEVIEDDGFEVSILENWQRDWEHGYDLQTLWAAHRERVLSDHIRMFPGTRPYVWWKIESGLERKVGPMQLTERTLVKRWRFTLRESIPENQRAWLLEHGHLQDGE